MTTLISRSSTPAGHLSGRSPMASGIAVAIFILSTAAILSVIPSGGHLRLVALTSPTVLCTPGESTRWTTPTASPRSPVLSATPPSPTSIC